MKILIAEDHTLIVDGLRSILDSNGYAVTHAINDEQLLRLLQQHTYDVLLQDIRFGKTDARSFLPSLGEDFPDLKIIALTSLDDLASIQSVLASKVHGYVLKAEPSSVLLQAIEAVKNGTVFLSPEVQSVLVKRSDNEAEIRLSERERTVLNGIFNEQSTREIAETLFISEKTVEHYRASLFTKFDVKNMSGLVKKALLLGFYDPNYRK